MPFALTKSMCARLSPATRATSIQELQSSLRPSADESAALPNPYRGLNTHGFAVL
jgi:hypothetical protein